MKILSLILGVTLLACAGAAAAATLTWTDNATNETTQTVKRKAIATPTAPATPTQACQTDPAPFGSTFVVGANVTSYTDATVAEGQTYCYTVSASNPVGESANSNIVGITAPFLAIPASPSGVGVTALP